jgi:hypothetical protein
LTLKFWTCATQNLYFDEQKDKVFKKKKTFVPLFKIDFKSIFVDKVLFIYYKKSFDINTSINETRKDSSCFVRCKDTQQFIIEIGNAI